MHARDPSGRTPLHHAARSSGAAGLVAILLDAGADPNATARFGLTPLRETALNNDVAAARLLLDAGADPRATTPDGRSALDLAVGWDAGHLAPLIRRAVRGEGGGDA